MYGEIEIEVKSSKDLRLLDKRTYRNVVVNGAKLQTLKLLAGDIGTSPSYRYIKYMQFGTGTLPESEEDTALQLPITPIKTVSPSYPHSGMDDDYFVRFFASLNQNNANGFPISEAGLVTGDLFLFARKTFSAIDKTVDFIIEFTWTIRC